jgi:hypothetical protein
MVGWTALFLATTLLTTITGFFLPATMLLPSHITGIISLIVLVPALIGLYVFQLAGTWRWIYVGGRFSRSISTSSSRWCRPS